MLYRYDALVVVPVAGDEVEDRHAGYSCHPRVGRESTVDACGGRQIFRVTRSDSTHPVVARVAAHRDALPAVIEKVDGAVIVVAANYARGVAGPDGTGRLVLLA